MDEQLFPETPAAPEIPAAAKETAPTFEEALAELEALVRQMETGQLPLDRLIVSYEKGAKLAHFCRSRLDELEKKIKILSGDGENPPQWQDFDPASGR